MLHITNGVSAVEGLREAGVEGEIIAWKDVLHEGPVPAGLSLNALREVRARFIAGRGWGRYQDVLSNMTQRDAALEGFRAHDEVVLWFEHDLYDQLQMIQVLDWFRGRDPGRTRLSVVGVNEYLATLEADRLTRYFEGRQDVTREQLDLAARAWDAFRLPDPSLLVSLVREGTPSLPFLGAALFRHAQQFPSTANGLSFSETHALDAIGKGRSPLCEAFLASHHEREEHIFLGDTIFATYIEGLSMVEHPLVLFENGEKISAPREPEQHESFWVRTVLLTDAGRSVLNGSLDHVRLNGINRWLGGVFLNGNGPVWRWDAGTQQPIYG